jgi:hypothetical protein
MRSRRRKTALTGLATTLGSATSSDQDKVKMLASAVTDLANATR